MPLDFAAARQAVEREYSTTTEPYGAEDRRDWRIIHDPDGITGTATLVSKKTGKVREVFVPESFSKLDGMERVGDWPSV